MGKALQHETLSAGSANTEKLIREPGLEFTVTAQFSCPPRESPTEMPGMTLSPHPGVQRVKGRVCFEASTSMVSLTPSQAVEGAAIFSNSEGGDGTGLVLPCVENPAATTCSYSLGIQGPVCSRE